MIRKSDCPKNAFSRLKVYVKILFVHTQLCLLYYCCDRKVFVLGIQQVHSVEHQIILLLRFLEEKIMVCNVETSLVNDVQTECLCKGVWVKKKAALLLLR